MAQSERQGFKESIDEFFRGAQLKREVGDLERQVDELLSDPASIDSPERRTEALRLYGQLSMEEQKVQQTGRGIAAGAAAGAVVGIPLPVIGLITGGLLGGIAGHFYTRSLRGEMLSRIRALRGRLESAFAGLPASAPEEKQDFG